jgi:hypothetical protein
MCNYPLVIRFLSRHRFSIQAISNDVHGVPGFAHQRCTLSHPIPALFMPIGIGRCRPESRGWRPRRALGLVDFNRSVVVTNHPLPANR